MDYNFIFKPFNEMTEEDYKQVGFMSGLEIHQQLLTQKKLFCRCPAGKYSTDYDAEILRHMRPTLSELGEYDGTALMEFKTKKDIVYRIKRETVCTYEMDDTPPFQINEEALDIALKIGMLYDCSLVDEIHIARKQYLDGSIPTGFQRTSIIALDGKIPYKEREINIIQLSIEEDSCREVSDIGHVRVYLTDRLGMPLIETVTGPDMRTPHEVADVANICRRLVRSTGNVRTGIGAAREDVNVSVTGGTRIEIKGVSKIADIPLLTYNEAMRQWNLLRLREELKKRGITPETFSAKFENVTKLMKKTYYKPVLDAIHQGMVINCVVLKGYKELLHWQTQTDTYFSREISDRVRVIACLTTIPNIIHSDSKGESLSSAEWAKLRKAAGATEEDTLVLVWGSEQDVATASKEIIIRAKEATIGVPSETRQALRDGTNGFERILPGPERMYPDTDLPPKRITSDKLKELSEKLPEKIWLREDRYRKLKLPEDVIEVLSVSRFAKLFDKLTLDMKLNPVFVSVALIQHLKHLKRTGLNTDRITDETLEKIFCAYKDGKLSRNGVLRLIEIAVVKNGDIDEFIPNEKFSKDLKMLVKNGKEELAKLIINKEEKIPELLTGLTMKNIRNFVEGRTAAELTGFNKGN